MARTAADYERIACSTLAADGAARGCMVGLLWGLTMGGAEAKGLQGSAYAMRMASAGAASALNFGVLLGAYSGLNCAFGRLKDDTTPAWQASAAAGAGAGAMTSLPRALRLRRPNVFLVTTATMAVVTGALEAARGSMSGGGGGHVAS